MSTTTAEMPEPSSDSRAWSTPQRKVLAALLGVMFLFQITTLRPGHDWGGDFAQYLSHARNLATLQPYADTGYVYNPDAAEIGPQAYPPIFPLLLAPLVGLYGVDLVVLKVAMLLLFLGSLLVAANLFARRLSAWGTIVTIGVLAFCPVFWEFNHQIISEHLFVFWWLLAIWLYERTRATDATSPPSLRWGVALGFVIYLAIGTRMVGVVLPAAVLVTEAIRFRRLTSLAAAAVGVSGAMYLLQAWVLPAGGAGYLAQLSEISPRTLAENLYADVVSFSYVWRNGHWEWLREGAGVLFALVAAYGYLRANWPAAPWRPQLLAVASLGYFLLIIVWPSAAWTRMIWPLLPGFVFWIVYALENMPVAVTVRRSLLVAFATFTLASYAAWYAQADYTRIAGPEDRTAQELFLQVQRNVGEEEVVLFFKPRVMALLARRRSVGFPDDEPPEVLAKTFDRHQVAWAAVDRAAENDTLRTVLQSRRFRRVWQNEAFELWQQEQGTQQAEPTPAE